MPTIRDDNVVEAIASEYLANGMVKSLALETVGYARGYSRSGPGLALYGNIRVKREIARLQAENRVKMDYSLDSQRKKLDLAYDIAKKQRNPAGMTAAVREQNAVSGHHIQTILTDPDQTKELDEAQRVMAEEIIRLRRRLEYGVVDVEARSGSAPAPVADKYRLADNIDNDR